METTAEELASPKKIEKTMNDTSEWYPYIIPASYIKDPKSISPHAITRPFGHGLYISLVRDFKGIVGNLTPEDLKNAGVTVSAAYTRAYSNLEKLLQSNKIKLTAYPKGPNDAPFILICDHWNAGTCILLPGIYEMSKRALHNEQIVAIVPHREVLLIFPKPDKDGLERLREFARKNEGDARKPLSFELFELSKDGPIELK